jgi:hypothetical protein
MKTWILLFLFCLVAGFGGSYSLMQIAEAQAVVEVDPAPVPDGPATSPDGYAGSPAAVAAADGVLPFGWDWMDAFVVLMAGLGALAGFFRVVAPLTATTKDDWFLNKLEWLIEILSKLFVPGRYRTKDNVKFPVPSTSSGGKTGGVV